MISREEIARQQVEAFLTDFSQIVAVHLEEENEIYSDYLFECRGLNGDFKVHARAINAQYCVCRIVEGRE